VNRSLEAVAETLRDRVDALAFASPVVFTYNPLSYAWRSHRAYLQRFGAGPKRVVFLGMNPGPFGMAQTGVPFGDVETVGEWLGNDEPVEQPPSTHPKRPIQGLACPRVEVSGQRLWGWVRERWSVPERFFDECFVVNYCPLVFLEDTGRNRTPDKLPVDERRTLFEVCDAALAASLTILEPDWVVGVGRFARLRAETLDGPWRVGEMLHPSPASPAANRGWRAAAETQLQTQGIF
jgi:single-strand selective monofunctional uracil DNA glycosylase